jgi:hypothetical protein
MNDLSTSTAGTLLTRLDSTAVMTHFRHDFEILPLMH